MTIKKIALFLIVISMSAFSEEFEYVDFSVKEPVIQRGLKEAKTNVKANFVYNENDMYRVYARAGFLTTINLNPDEEIIYIAGGDTARWAIDEGKSGSSKGVRTILTIKPFFPGIKTNLVINTNKRSYNIFLHSADDWYNPIIEFLYPNDAKISLFKKESTEEKTTLVNMNNLNYSYNWKKTKDKWNPSQVFDDGHKTFIVMNEQIETGEAPALFIKDEQSGKLAIVNYRMKNNYYIVDRLFEQAILKLGKKEIIIKKDGSFIKNEKDYYPVRR